MTYLVKQSTLFHFFYFNRRNSCFSYIKLTYT
nr:MAG TPA: hypothetical protein [Caudoviricetes sp.]